jgi:hypothetical protein
MSDYNLIPLGDHCAISEILNALELRKSSYPFDWITNTNLVYNTNLISNFEIITELMEKHNVKEIVQKFLGNAMQTPNKIFNSMWFPHDDGTEEFVIAKYERRFERLYTDIKEKQNIFIMLTRHIVIPEQYFNYILSRLLSYNPLNKILFVSGSDHPYLYEPQYKSYAIFKHINYDVKTLDKDFTQDFQEFRPAIREYMRELFSKMGFTVPPAPVLVADSK